MGLRFPQNWDIGREPDWFLVSKAQGQDGAAIWEQLPASPTSAERACAAPQKLPLFPGPLTHPPTLL